MINDPKEIKEVLNAIDKIKKEDLDKAIGEVDNKLSEEEIIEVLKEFNKIKVNSYAMQFVNIPYPKLQQAIERFIRFI